MSLDKRIVGVVVLLGLVAMAMFWGSVETMSSVLIQAYVIDPFHHYRVQPCHSFCKEDSLRESKSSQKHVQTSNTLQNIIQVNTTILTYYEATPSPLSKGDVLILPIGGEYPIDTWVHTGTMNELRKNGYRVIAVELPGFTTPDQSTVPLTNDEKLRVVQEVLVKVGMKKPVLISASMSGVYSLPLLLEGATLFSGWVLVGPHGADSLDDSMVGGVDSKQRVLVVSGGLDRGAGQAAVNHLRYLHSADIKIIDNSRHHCYIDTPKQFHSTVLEFLKKTFNNKITSHSL